MIVALIFWTAAQLKPLVLEHGIVLGAFYPSGRPPALPFSAIDTTSFRAVRGLSRPRDVVRHLGLDPVDHGASRSHV